MSDVSDPDPHRALTPSPWVVRHAALVPAGAHVLDFACGHGRHARFFAARGCRVLAVDRHADALATMSGIAGIATRTVDLEGVAWPLGGEQFDAIVVTNYLHRHRFPDLLAALEDDGALLYETFACGNEAYGRPSNPDYLLQRGELVSLTQGRLHVIAFEEGFVGSGARGAVVQRIAAVGPRRAWPVALSG